MLAEPASKQLAEEPADNPEREEPTYFEDGDYEEQGQGGAEAIFLAPPGPR
jgi:hypothetical protein